MDRKTISRRHFLRSSVTGLAGLTCFSPRKAKRDLGPTDRKFIFRTLGKTGIRVPVIGMGMLLSDKADLMRAYMYAYGYRRPTLARSLLASLDLPDRVCEDCSSCAAICQNQWNVGEKVRDVVRLRDHLLV